MKVPVPVALTSPVVLVPSPQWTVAEKSEAVRELAVSERVAMVPVKEVPSVAVMGVNQH